MNILRPHFGYGDVHDLTEWQRAAQLTADLEKVCDELDLKPNEEWLRFLVLEAGHALPAAVEEGWKSEYLAEFMLSLYEAHSLLAMIEYYTLFLRDEGYLEGRRADEVDNRRQEVQDLITSLLDRMRDSWRADYEATLQGTGDH
jgi:four helix bundle protein